MKKSFFSKILRFNFISEINKIYGNFLRTKKTPELHPLSKIIKINIIFE